MFSSVKKINQDKKIIIEMGANLPLDSSLIPVIRQCDGSARDILTAAVQIAEKSIATTGE